MANKRKGSSRGKNLRAKVAGFDSVKITITGARNGKSKIIKIHNNGQISVGS
jgi:hypothetical protein